MTNDDALKQTDRASPFRTICEVHREIYHGLAEVSEPLRTALRDKVIEAFVMGKRIDAKLREYNQAWDDGFYVPNADRRADRMARAAR